MTVLGVEAVVRYSSPAPKGPNEGDPASVSLTGEPGTVGSGVSASSTALTYAAHAGTATGIQIGPVLGVPVVVTFGGASKPFSFRDYPTTTTDVIEPGSFSGAALGQNPGSTPGSRDIGSGAVGGGGSAEGGTGLPEVDIIPVVWSTPVAGYDPDSFSSNERIYPIRRA